MTQTTLRILVAEDNRADVILMQEALAEYALTYSLRVLSDGAETLSFLRGIDLNNHPACPDMILLDLNLPKVDGHELLRLIREHPVCSDVPVIVVTSSDSAEDRQRAAQLGATDYFRKPSSLEEFLKLGGIVKRLTAAG